MNKDIYDIIIIGAGLSGLAVAAFLKKSRPDINLLIIEKNNRPGGAIRTYSEEGYLAESGAHGFLDNCNESMELAKIAGVEEEIVSAPLSRFGRYICQNGRLKLIPQKPGKIIMTGLVPITAKLRILGDLWKSPLTGEPSVADWVSYRFGKRILPFADAVFTGTYAGDIEKLTIDSVMPGLRALENEHGSVIRGFIKKQREKKETKQSKPRVLPAMTSFSAGMTRLPQSLANRLDQEREIAYLTHVERIVPGTDSWELQTNRKNLRCRHLVLALPVNQTLSLLTPASIISRPPLGQIEEARIATVALGFSDNVQIPFGFGFLAPESEKRFCLGALFSSHMFPERAPKNRFLIEILVGGRRHPERLDFDDNTLIDKAYQDVGQLLNITEKPHFCKVLHSQSGIPQLERGYPTLLSWRDTVHNDHKTIHICGFGWKGIGINDMTKESKKIAERILATDGLQINNSPEVKGIYF